MGKVTISVPCLTLIDAGFPPENSLLSPLTRMLLIRALWISYLRPISFTPVEESLWENTETIRPGLTSFR